MKNSSSAQGIENLGVKFAHFIFFEKTLAGATAVE